MNIRFENMFSYFNELIMKELNSFDFTVTQFVIDYDMTFIYTLEVFQDLSKNN